MQLDVTLRKGFRLGDWEVRPIEGLLEGAQGARHLQPKTMDVLVCLASSSGQVLTRDELIERVWDGHAVSDEPLTRCIHEIRRALGDPCGEARYIKTIPKRGYQLLPDIGELSRSVSASASIMGPRTAPDWALASGSVADSESVVPSVSLIDLPAESLPDSAVEQQASSGLFWEVTRQRVLWVGALYALLAWVFVQLARYAELQTTAGQAFPDWLVPALVVIVLLGFPVAIFFAWVRQIEVDQPHRLKAPDVTLNNMFSLLWSRRGIDVVLVTAVITGLAALAVDFTPPIAAEVAAAEHKSIAVIPFTHAAGNRDMEWLSVSLAEDLNVRLRDYSELDLSERGRSIGAAAEQLNAQQLGERLNVRYLLEGIVVEGNSGLRINATLTDAATGFEVWSGYYSQPANALPAIQQEMVTGITTALAVEQSYVADSAVSWPADLGGDAYISYLQGLYHLVDTADADSAARAAAWFERALMDDKRVAMAGIGLCQAYTRELEISGSAWAHGKAHQVCAGAVKQSPKLAAAHLAQADYYRVAGFPREAIDRYEWVTAQQPGNADAWRGLGMARLQEQITDGAEQAFRTALALRPGDIRTHEAYARFLLDAGRYAQAVAVGRTLVQLDRDCSAAYAMYAEALFNTGEFAGAIQAGRQAVANDLSNRAAIMTIADSYYYLGDYARAGQIYRQAARLRPDDPFAEGGMANSLAQVGEAAADEQARMAYARARLLAERALDSAQSDVQTMLALAYYCATLGDVPCAEQQQAKAVAAGMATGDEFYWSALVHAQLGDFEAASDAAQAALKRGYPQHLMLSDPLLAKVWSQYQFATVRAASFATANY